MVNKKVYCDNCDKYRQQFMSYPTKICFECCPKVSAGVIMERLDSAFHHHIYTNFDNKFPISQHNIDDLNKLTDRGKYSIFWITTNQGGAYQRCGANSKPKKFIENFVRSQDEYEINVYVASTPGEDGFNSMKHLKQSFKRIRSANPIWSDNR